MVYKEHVEVPD